MHFSVAMPMVALAAIMQPTPPSAPDRIIAVPPPPPVPPSYPYEALPARPVQPLHTYLSDDDYPLAALRNEEQGTVGFRLLVDETGTVTRCIVTSSSESMALDQTTCDIMSSRVRFHPARTVWGTSSPAWFNARLAWQIPEPVPPPSGD
jgi:periplasmic protein TonB